MADADIPPILDVATFRHLALEQLANGGGGGGSSSSIVAPPANETDFSKIGGSAPAPGTNLVFFAPRDANSIWEISSGQTSWKIIQTDDP